MPYIGRDLRTGAFRQLDDISSGFDGSDTTHTMQVNSTNVSVGDVNQILLSLGGVIQKPGTDFTVSGSTLTFTTAPAANTSFFAILLGSDNGGTTTPTDGSVTTSKIVDDAVTAAKVASSGAFAIGATGTSSSLAGIPFFSDTSNKSMYTHDVSGTDSTAAGNTAFGFGALDAITTGDDNTAIGENALSANNTASNNVAVGKNAGLALTSGDTNTAVGANALRTCTVGDRNVAIGTNAFYDLEPSSNANMENVAIGFSAGRLTTTGDYNTFLGAQTGYSVTTGSNNTLIGRYAGANFDTESHNIAIGRNALSGASLAGGEYNVALGNYAGDALTSSDHNVIIGYQTGTDMTGGGTVEGQNTLVGNYAGANLTNGYQNVHLGMQAGAGEGDGVGTDPTTGYRSILIGCFSNQTDASHSHAIVMGYAIAGEGDRFTFGKPSNTVQNTFTSNANWTRSSDERLKTNVADVNWKALDFINELRPITFNWKNSKDVPEEMEEYNTEENYMDTTTVIDGLLAQEVKTAMDKHSMDNFSGWDTKGTGTQVLSKEAFVLPLIKAVQELSAKVKALEEA